MSDTKKLIENGNAILGIEFGSTRIKAVLIDENHTPIAPLYHKVSASALLLHAFFIWLLAMFLLLTWQDRATS